MVNIGLLTDDQRAALARSDADIYAGENTVLIQRNHRGFGDDVVHQGGLWARAKIFHHFPGGSIMAFVNEYISDEDVEKYGIAQLRDELHFDYARRCDWEWTRDRERDAYLIQRSLWAGILSRKFGFCMKKAGIVRSCFCRDRRSCPWSPHRDPQLRDRKSVV